MLKLPRREIQGTLRRKSSADLPQKVNPKIVQGLSALSVAAWPPQPASGMPGANMHKLNRDPELISKVNAPGKTLSVSRAAIYTANHRGKNGVLA